MVKATIEETRRARRAAAVVAACVVAFALAYVGIVAALHSVAPHEQTQDITIAKKASSKTFYVLLIGSDTRKGTALYTGKATDHAQVDQHSDVMTLMRVDPKNYKVSLLSIPRDTVVEGETQKINNALLENDPNAVVDAVERLTGLRPDYYMMTTFANFAKLVDAVGGITVDVPVDVTVDDPSTGSKITVKAGANQHLDGAQALALSRARHEYGDNQDVIRQTNVRAVEAAIIERVLQYHSVEDIEHLLGVVEEDVQTNMDLPTVGLDMVEFMENAEKVTILSGSGPYEGGGPREGDGAWVIAEDEDAWKKVMKAFKKGKDPTSVISLPQQALAARQDSGTSSESVSSSASASAKSASASSGTASKKESK